MFSFKKITLHSRTHIFFVDEDKIYLFANFLRSRASNILRVSISHVLILSSLQGFRCTSLLQEKKISDSKFNMVQVQMQFSTEIQNLLNHHTSTHQVD